MGALTEISSYQKSDFSCFKKVFGEYFLHDLKCELSDQDLEKICFGIDEQVTNKVVFLDLFKHNQELKGFVIYQIDTPKSDWCEKEGYGFIREMFISADVRKLGFGKKLAQHAENHLKQLGVSQFYLTCDENQEFWIKLGYVNTGDICEKNESPIFIK